MKLLSGKWWSTDDILDLVSPPAEISEAVESYIKANSLFPFHHFVSYFLTPYIS